MNDATLTPSDMLCEPLADSAPFARQLAATCCPDPQDNQAGCGSYHGFWQYLRLMGLGKTLSGLPDCFIAGIDYCATGWQQSPTSSLPRILISGCADYSALAHVFHSCHKHGLEADITALDLCETPLLLSRWLARRLGTTLSTACENILNYHSPQGYDLILTSSFLGYFSPADRPHLFKTYAGNLRPGGILMFANRLRPEPEDVPVTFNLQQAQTFADHAARLASTLPDNALLSSAEAEQLALDYARVHASYPVNSADTIRTLAAQAGLNWLQGEEKATRALQSGISGPTLGDGSRYLFVMLQKPY